MPDFPLTVKELLCRQIVIDADNLTEALCIAEENYRAAELVLDADDFVTYHIVPNEHNVESLTLPEELYQHMQQIVAYLAHDEHRSDQPSNFPANHIDHSVSVLKKYLKNSW